MLFASTAHMSIVLGSGRQRVSATRVVNIFAIGVVRGNLLFDARILERLAFERKRRTTWALAAEELIK
jgi:hypothetical protein